MLEKNWDMKVIKALDKVRGMICAECEHFHSLEFCPTTKDELCSKCSVEKAKKILYDAMNRTPAMELRLICLK